MTATEAAPTSSMKGILLMLLSLFMLTCSDAATKWLGADYPPGQIVCFRALFSLLPVLVMVRFYGGFESLRIVDRKGQLWRAFYFAVGTTLIALSMILLPIADAAAILYAGPLMITALAVPMLKERVGWRRWTAVAVGFGGVVIMLRPTPGLVQWLGLLPLAAAFCSSMRDIYARRLSATDSSNSLMFWSALATVLLAGLSLPFAWATPTPFDLALMVVTGLFIGVAHYCMIESYRISEAAVVAPFKYSGILWAVVFGYFVWGDIPDAFILTGGTVVVASGLYILHRQTRRGASV
ncbi:MAG: DMT family transporter [Rickettsiales bacterium]|jgi:drug/metabolite transporter (DMT)-like permease